MRTPMNPRVNSNALGSAFYYMYLSDGSDMLDGDLRGLGNRIQEIAKLDENSQAPQIPAQKHRLHPNSLKFLARERKLLGEST